MNVDHELLAHAGTDDKLATELEQLRQAHWSHWTPLENHTVAVAVRVLRVLDHWRRAKSGSHKATQAVQEAIECLAEIADATDADNAESYRNDDPQGCLDHVHAMALARLDAVLASVGPEWEDKP